MKISKAFLVLSLCFSIVACNTLDNAKRVVKEDKDKSLSLGRVSVKVDEDDLKCGYSLRNVNFLEYAMLIGEGIPVGDGHRKNVEILRVSPGEYNLEVNCFRPGITRKTVIVTNHIVKIPEGGKKVYIGDIDVEITNKKWAGYSSAAEATAAVAEGIITLPFNVAKSLLSTDKKEKGYKVKFSVNDRMEDALKDYDKYFGADDIPVIKSLAVKKQ